MKNPLLKKLLLIFLAIGIFGCLYFFMPTDFIRAVSKEEARVDTTVYIYCDSYDGEYIPNGSGAIVKTTFADYPSALANCTAVKGTSIEFAGTPSDINAILSRLEVTVISSDGAADVASIYGYSPLVKGGIAVDGHVINIHIAYSGGTVSIGSPLILGSF
jgi:hypothetical protein